MLYQRRSVKWCCGDAQMKARATDELYQPDFHGRARPAKKLASNNASTVQDKIDEKRRSGAQCHTGAREKQAGRRQTRVQAAAQEAPAGGLPLVVGEPIPSGCEADAVVA